LAKTRILFVSDIRGSERLFLKSVNAVPIYKAQALVIGGDVVGKAITPLFKKVDELKAEVQGTWRTAKTKEELEQLDKDIRSIGNYPYVTTEEEWAELAQNSTMMDKLFDVAIKESIEKWCRIGEERLKKIGVQLIMNKGNGDPPIIDETLRKSTFVEFPNEKIIRIENHEMLSLGYSNMTPWKLSGDLPEEVLQVKLETLANQTQDMKNAIFNIHVPPYNTLLDLAPKLDENLTPVLTPAFHCDTSGREPEMVHVGSTAVRTAIEKFQPLLSVHGHVRESKGAATYMKIGRTHCFNPGSQHETDQLQGLLLDVSDNKLDGHVFTSG
jgi:hypothetical protein